MAGSITDNSPPESAWDDEVRPAFDAFEITSRMHAEVMQHVQVLQQRMTLLTPLYEINAQEAQLDTMDATLVATTRAAPCPSDFAQSMTTDDTAADTELSLPPASFSTEQSLPDMEEQALSHASFSTEGSLARTSFNTERSLVNVGISAGLPLPHASSSKEPLTHASVGKEQSIPPSVFAIERSLPHACIGSAQSSSHALLNIERPFPQTSVGMVHSLHHADIGKEQPQDHTNPESTLLTVAEATVRAWARLSVETMANGRVSIDPSCEAPASSKGAVPREEASARGTAASRAPLLTHLGASPRSAATSATRPRGPSGGRASAYEWELERSRMEELIEQQRDQLRAVHDMLSAKCSALAHERAQAKKKEEAYAIEIADMTDRLRKEVAHGHMMQAKWRGSDTALREVRKNLKENEEALEMAEREKEQLKSALKATSGFLHSPDKALLLRLRGQDGRANKVKIRQVQQSRCDNTRSTKPRKVLSPQNGRLVVPEQLRGWSDDDSNGEWEISTVVQSFSHLQAEASREDESTNEDGKLVLALEAYSKELEQRVEELESELKPTASRQWNDTEFYH